MPKRIGIVGSEKAKFTAISEARAKEMIQILLRREDVTEVVSGACHLGGIDTWAAEIGHVIGLKVTEFPPRTKSWEGGYKQRNLQIAENSDEVYCITVNALPAHYSGMRFNLCYHCGTSEHVKSGGCWTVKQAKRMGKPTGVLVVKQEEVLDAPA